MKRCFVFFVLTAVLFCSCFGVCANAGSEAFEEAGRVVDSAMLISEEEEAEIIDKYDALSEKYDCDIFCVTDTVDYSGRVEYIVEEYAISFYEDRFGASDSDAIILTILISENDPYNRAYNIYARGYGHTLLTEGNLDILEDAIFPYLSNSDYASAINEFVNECEALIHDDKTVGIGGLFLALVFGAVLALIVVFNFKAQLKSVELKRSAAGYVRQGSMVLEEQSDLFMYRNITRTPIPRDTGPSGGGRSGGGGGGGSSSRSGSF